MPKSIHNQILATLKLQAGDTVRITHKVPSEQHGWSANWVKEMDACVGKTYIVLELRADLGVRVRDGGTVWSFPAQCVELVPRKQKLPVCPVKQIGKYRVTLNDDNASFDIGCTNVPFKTVAALHEYAEKIRALK